MILENPQERFEEIYQIMLESFPDSERRTREGQRALLDNPFYHIRTVEEEGNILAFLLYWDLPGCRFMEHLATTPACRGRGIGKGLVEECLQDGKRPVFLEIEPITEEEPMTGRRAGFYERLGFCLNRFPYLQMPLKEGDKPVPLWIMSYQETVTEEAFGPYKTEIYEYVYGIPGKTV